MIGNGKLRAGHACVACPQVSAKEATSRGFVTSCYPTAGAMSAGMLVWLWSCITYDHSRMLKGNPVQVSWILLRSWPPSQCCH
eukprot:scaffold288049_cov31-Prasinocladus_malaysianus.AAC.1